METSTSLISLFEDQVARYPCRIAVKYGEEDITYQDILDQAGFLAARLRDHGVAPGQVVGLFLPRSPEAIMAILGIWMAGAAYLPIDPGFPYQRQQFMIDDSGTQVLVTSPEYQEIAQSHPGRQVFFLDRAQKETGAPLAHPHAPKPLYMLYTSGSTGRPKAVLGSHSATYNRLNWMWTRYPYAQDEVTLHRTSLNFVDSLSEIFAPLLKGVPQIILPQAQETDWAGMIALLNTHSATRLLLVPSLLYSLIKFAPDLGKRLPAIRWWAVSGEPLTPKLLAHFQKAVPGATLINLYGSTEVAGDVTSAELKPGIIPRDMPIGTPLPYVQAYILDDQGKPLSSGQTGALYIGGATLAHGYHNRPQEQAERFQKNPFQPEQKMFRTGDLAYRGDDGLLYYKGREDHQIQLHGVRLELGEVEAALHQTRFVDQGVVVPQGSDPDNLHLVAFVTPSQAPTTKIKRALATRLPKYMVPTVVFALDQLPRLSNGKVDRQSLTAHNPWRRRTIPADLRPKPGIEEKIAAMWSSRLAIPVVSRNDTFFALGGDSLALVGFLVEARDQLGVAIGDASFPKDGSPAQMAAWITGERNDAQTSTTKHPIRIQRLEEPYVADTVRCIAESFTRDDPLSVRQGISERAFRGFIEPLVQMLTGSLSQIAVDETTDRVVGFALGVDYAIYAEEDDEMPPEAFMPILVMLDQLKAEYDQTHEPYSYGETLDLFITGVSAHIDGIALIFRLEKALSEAAAAASYQRLVNLCTHGVTHYIAKELGFRPCCHIAYDDFVFEGKKPFAAIPGHLGATLYEKRLG